MTKQEEIREGAILILQSVSLGELNEYEAVVKLSGLGVVIKVDRELPELERTYLDTPSIKIACIRARQEERQSMLKAGYVAVEPLIE